jgi:CubicO group peptidase (beta-lactamase class C family)
MKVSAQELRLHDARNQKFWFLAAGLGAFAIAAAICNGATPSRETTEPIWPTKEWQMSTPEKEGMDSKELAKLVDFGAFRSFDSLLVVRHGKIVAEAYYAPYTAGIPHAINSCTKAVIATLTGIAVKDGLLDTPSHRALDFFDRRDIANLDERKEAITIQHLLDMTSGMSWDQPLYGSSTSVTAMSQSPNWVKFILDRPMSNPPGAKFNYSDGDAHLLSAIIAKLTSISALEYAKAKLFGPLGISNLFWPHDPQGISMAGFGLYLLPRDMAKIGYLYLRNGAWEGKQLLPVTWVERIAHATADPNEDFGHANLFWVLPDKHVYMAAGVYRQLIVVFPDLDVVTVMTARADNYSLGEWTDAIYSSVKSDQALPADAAGAKLLADKTRDAATEKPTEIGPVSGLAAIITGKVYNFPPNQINLKSLTLRLTDPKPSYDIATYAQDSTKSGPGFTGSIGLEGLYGRGELSSHGYNHLFEGRPRVYVLKGAWQDDHTFVIDRLILGEGPTQIWTLTFDGSKLNVRFKFGALPEISVDGETGG